MSQECAAARQWKLKRKLFKENELVVGDEVWILFPKVKKGRSKKLAMRCHGPYKLVEWREDERRSAVVAKEGEDAQRFVVHVSRMITKEELPERLKKEWKPLEWRALSDKDLQEDRVMEAEVEVEQFEEIVEDVIMEEVEVVEEEEESTIEAIVGHEDSEAGLRQYRVRWEGFAPTEDTWFDDEILSEQAPELVEEYENDLKRLQEIQKKKDLKKRRKKQRRKGRK